MSEEEQFLKYFKESMKEFLRRRADEIVRVKVKAFYIGKNKKAQDEAMIKEFLANLDDSIDELVKLYVEKLKKEKLTSPEAIQTNGKKVDEIAKEIEGKLKKKLEKLK